MNTLLIINGHAPHPFSPGGFNSSLVELATETLQTRSYAVQHSAVQDAYDIERTIEKHIWADAVILQAPVNGMGVPWTFKRHMDEAYTAGLAGRLCEGDGRTRWDGSKQYGSGGRLNGKYYMTSLTNNAPVVAFDNPDQDYFSRKGAR